MAAGRAGWRVRYAAEVDIWHEHRVRVRDFAGDRRRYAASLGPLARRHPGAAPAMWVSPGLAAPWALALAGRPRAAAASVAWAAVRHRARLRRRADGLVGARGAVALAGAGVARGLGATGLGLAYGARRAWAPPLVALARHRPRLRVALVAAFAVPVIQDAAATRDAAGASRRGGAAAAGRGHGARRHVGRMRARGHAATAAALPPALGRGDAMSRVAVVTGAARGIGAATVTRLAQEGWSVVAVDRCADDPRLPYGLGTAEDLDAVAARARELAGAVARCGRSRPTRRRRRIWPRRWPAPSVSSAAWTP